MVVVPCGILFQRSNQCHRDVPRDYADTDGHVTQGDKHVMQGPRLAFFHHRHRHVTTQD